MWKFIAATVASWVAVGLSLNAVSNTPSASPAHQIANFVWYFMTAIASVLTIVGALGTGCVISQMRAYKKNRGG